MLKVALLGLGTMGKLHADVWSRMPGVQIVGVSGQNQLKTNEIAAQYGVKAHYSLDQLLDEAEFDVLDICLPTYLHKPYTIQAARAGRHVITEKPLGLTVEEGQEMIDTCLQHNVNLFVCHTLRFCPEYANARSMVASGALGRIGVVRLSRNSSYPNGWNDWFADFSKSGGLTLDLLIHDLDWLRWTFDEVTRVTAQRVFRAGESGKLEYVLISLRMMDGTIAHVEGSWAHSAFTSKFEIAGDKGMLVENMADSTPLQVHTRSSHGKNQQDVIVPEVLLHKNPVQRQLEHFADCLMNGKQPIVTAYDGLKAVEIARAALLSIETGQPVEIRHSEVSPS
jgi:predicted dehydrogenase